MTGVGRISLQVVLCVAPAVGAYFWVTALMGSLDAYRSPFHGRTVAAGDAVGPALTRRVVFVYVDGLRVDTAADAQVMPFLNQLRLRAAWTTSHSRQPSYSVPGYTTMLTGAWPEFNDGPLLNPEYKDTTAWPQDNLFVAAKRAGLKVALSDNYFAEKLVPQDALTDHFYSQTFDPQADRDMTDAALRWVATGAHQFVLVHLDQVDHAGHAEGPRATAWKIAARNVDGLLRDIAGALDLERDTIFITSDHGHIDAGGHGGDESAVVSEPFVLAGAGVKPGHYADAQMADIAPTLAALLGVNVPALSQGHVRVDMLKVSPEQRAAIEAASAKQQARWIEAYTAATGQAVAVPASADAVSATQTALADARAARLSSERVLRIALSALAGVAIALALWFARGRALAWQALGAVTYLVVFHFCYAVLQGRTYSLSSVLNQVDIVGACVFMAGFALALGCVVALAGIGTFRQGAQSAADAALGTALVTIAVAGVPALVGFALNGAVVTWALPDFPLMYLTFIALLQIVGVGLFALLCAALAGVIAWRTA